MKITYQNRTKRGKAGLAIWLRKGIIAWLVAAGLEFLLLPAAKRTLEGLDGLAAMSPVRMLLVAAVVFGCLTALTYLLPSGKWERWLMVSAFGVLAAVSLAASFTGAFLAVCMLVLLLMVVYALSGWNRCAPERSAEKAHPVWGWITAGLAAGFFLFVSAWTVCRVYSFATPTFDFTIFAQMFHSMKTTGVPMTTVERDGPLSHFAVHMSPVYYLLLPFYALVPTPATLQVLQAALLASAVIPLWKLGKLHGLTAAQRTLLCAVLLVYPAYSGGASYDIHENAFLTPLILWLLYGMDRKSIPITAVSAVLTLMVKEDAAVYVAVIGLYLLLRSALGKGQTWGLAAGAGLLAGALLWFMAVTGYLTKSGDGVMTYRYSNFMYDGSSSLVTVIKAVLLCPMKAVFECVDPEKLEFIALTLLPLGLLPLVTRRYQRFVLLIPYVLVNLMSDYQYQHDIFFQYTYGATACLLYLTLVNLADMGQEKLRVAALLAALCIGAGCFGAQVVPKGQRYISNCETYEAHYDKVRQTLDVIPEKASVAATTFYTTRLSQRDTLYDIRYASLEHILSCEYAALDVRNDYSYKTFASGNESGYENFVELLEENGYELIAQYEGYTEIYQKQ